MQTLHNAKSGVHLANMSDEVKSKGGAGIEVGDTVETPYRGGTHTFEVCTALWLG